MKPNRRSFRWKVRLLLGGWLQSLAWRLTDAHDAWVISYQGEGGGTYMDIFSTHYNIARARARELKGQIDGVSRGSVAEETGPQDGADWWKRGGP